MAGLTAEKAKKILKDGMVNGKPLTKKQKAYFGLIVGGGKSNNTHHSSHKRMKKYV
jgi:hypothetical protein